MSLIGGQFNFYAKNQGKICKQSGFNKSNTWNLKDHVEIHRWVFIFSYWFGEYLKN